MSRHLSPREIVEAAESALGAARGRHLDGCQRCRDQVDALRTTLTRIGEGVDVPEPPAAFWGDLRRRVRRQSADAAALPAPFWWGWRVLAFAAPAALALAVFLTPDTPLPDVPTAPGPRAAVAQIPEPTDLRIPAPESAPAWPAIADLAAAAGDEPLQTATPVRGMSADALLVDLTEAERVELLRLLRAEMGGGA